MNIYFGRNFQRNSQKLQLQNKRQDLFSRVYMKIIWRPKICWTSPFREAHYPATIKEVVDVERSSQELTDVNKIFQIQFPPERLEIFCL